MLNYLSSESDIRIFILCSNYLYIYIFDVHFLVLYFRDFIYCFLSLVLENSAV